MAYFRPTWMELDLDAVRSNVQTLKKYVGDEVHIMAVIKSNAYGYGMMEIAEKAIAAGASWLGVATLDEALFVRSKLSNRTPILVLTYTSPEHLLVASRNCITVTAVSLQWIKEASQIAKHTFDFHLKLDTGLNRLGCKTIEEVRAVARIVTNNSYMNWTGAFTHFATANDIFNKSYYHRQLRLFGRFLKVIPDREKKLIHCANSGITLYQSEKPFYNMVRLGRALTGPPIQKLQYLQSVPLIPIKVSLHSTLVLVKQLRADEKIGYDGTYTTTQRQWIGTVPIGYGDGWHQHFGATTVLIDGNRVPIVGKISMDQLMVALPHYHPVGTKVTLIGQQGNESISLYDMEITSGQKKHEIFTTFSNRIPRIYRDNGLVVSVKNPILDSVAYL